MHNITDNRQIRIFISSTFQDMQAERDHLITKVFPRLQEEAARRGVYVVPLDLRWGITEEESKSGKVLQICLEEIDNSRPFFIGLIGNRYGWCPPLEELDQNEILKERWGDWIENDIRHGLSITEIEIQYGVLRAKYDLNAFFFIKGQEDCEIDNQEKLRKLKQTIRENKRYPVHDYYSTEDLGEQVENAFLEVLNKYFSPGNLSELEKELAAQKVFQMSRTEIYVPKNSYYADLDRFLHNPNQPFYVVVGESGTGKSALLANWAERIKDDAEWTIFFYPIGNRKKDSNIIDLLTTIYKEVCETFSIQCEEDIDKSNNENEIVAKLAAAAANHKILIIWDGINQLASDSHSISYTYLPNQISSNIKIIFSTTPYDKSMELIKQRRFPHMTLSLLEEDDREIIAKKYLRHLRKNLTPDQMSRIIKGPNNNNALVLKTLLNELVNFGKHEEIDKYIDHYLQATTTKEFFNLVIKRFETSYGSSLVSTCLAAIAFSSYGLSESEIIEITHARPLDWSSLFCALKPHLIIRNGLLTFSHQLFKEAVSDSYADIKELVLQSLLKYFESKITTRKESCYAENYFLASPYTGQIEFLDDDTNSGLLFHDEGDTPAVINYTNNTVIPYRSFEELPSLYEALNENVKLYELLLDFGAFLYWNKTNATALSRMWHKLEAANDGRYKLSGFLDLPYKSNREYATYFINIAQFIEDYIQDRELASLLYMRALEIEEKERGKEIDDKFISADIYSSIAQHFLRIENYDKALELFNKALQISLITRGEYSFSTASCYNYLGLTFHYIGNKKDTLFYHMKALKCFPKEPKHDEIHVLADIYSNLAIMYDDIHNYKKAIESHKKCIELRLKIYSTTNVELAMAYNGLAYTYDSIKDFKKAIKYYLLAIHILNESDTIVQKELAIVHENLGITFCNLKKWESAYEHVQKAYNIYSRYYGNDHHQTLACKRLLCDICFLISKSGKH